MLHYLAIYKLDSKLLDNSHMSDTGRLESFAHIRLFQQLLCILHFFLFFLYLLEGI